MKTFSELEQDYQEALNNFKEIDRLLNTKMHDFVEGADSFTDETLTEELNQSLTKLILRESLYIEALELNYPQHPQLERIKKSFAFTQKLYDLFFQP